MKCLLVPSLERPWTALARCVCAVVVAFALGKTVAQAPAAPQPGASQQPAAAQAQTPQQPAATTPARGDSSPQPTAAQQGTQAGAITEDEVKQLLVGKTLYLRDGYLDNSLSFDEHGKLISHSAQGSYTLSLVEIDKVHLSKHKVELTGIRYGLHFLGARADEDPTKAVDKVRITPKKKVLKITIDRELVVTPKKKKGKKGEEAEAAKAVPATAVPNAEPSDAEQAKAEMNAAPEAERPADAGSVTTTTSPAHAAHMLRDAIDRMFARGLDERMIAAMPSFWKVYYQAVANQADYKPTDPAIYRQSGVDEKAKLLSTIEPPSNEYAQASGVAGMALYHAVIGADGKPQEIVVSRPIGFGLDESAADTIRKASFQPAMKDGKPVPVVLDLVVQFRIYSKRTNQTAKPEVEAKNSGPKLPGPYSVNHQ
ncbi:MAG TPA: energy transducer TonB [Terracidiphilus sp.]|jgi:outer membrane biosynthesis protein TonB|nr:energy transducer TonB [Terracidiphilus sp.]